MRYIPPGRDAFDFETDHTLNGASVDSFGCADSHDSDDSIFAGIDLFDDGLCPITALGTFDGD